MLRIIFLGTGCMIPTKYRNLLSVALIYNGDVFLFDCGENTQLQIKKAKIHLGKIKNIFISHWHGDHVLGLPGLLQTLNNINVVKEVNIYGPKGSKKFIKNMINSSIVNFKIKVNVIEINSKKKKTILETKDYYIYSYSLFHSTPVLGYSFVEKDKKNINKEKLEKLNIKSSPLLKELKEGKDILIDGKKLKSKEFIFTKKGKKISFIFDTIYDEKLINYAKNSDILISESTFLYSKNKEDAYKNKHMTSLEAGKLAKLSNAKKLILTHFSQRYKDLSEIKLEAEKEFNNVIISEDLMEINL